jgi:CHAD domain-containing protein
MNPKLLALFFLLLSSVPAWAARECDLLLKNIGSHDTVFKDVHLPEDLKSLLKDVDTGDYFQLCQDLWNQGFARKDVLDLIDTIEQGRTPTALQQNKFKDVRVRVRLLRSAYAAFDKDHQAPKTIDAITTVMGHLQDDVKAGSLDLSKKDAQDLADLMDGKSIKKVSEELGEFRPAKNKSFRNWVKDEADVIQEGLDADEVSAKEFHEMRKVITRVLAVVDVINSTDPSVESRQLGKYLSSLNTRMGDIHDGFVTKKIAGKMNYYKDAIKIPADIRGYLGDFIDALK